MSSKEIIRLKKIGHIYNPGEVSVVSLSDISLEIKQGEFIAITGPSGAGAVNPAAVQIDFYIRSPETNADNHPSREVFDHFFAMETTWR